MDNRARISPALARDIEPIARDMRPEDAQEVLAASGHSPEQALRASWMVSRWAFTIYDPEGVLGMFGVSDLGDDVGSPWLLATPALFRRHRRTFIPGSRAVVRRMQAEFTSLVNYVDARNLTSIRWLRWLGFTVHPAVPHGVAGLPFHRFTWSRS